MSKNTSKFKGLKYRSVSAAIIAGFIGAVVLLNVVMALISNKFPFSIDLTKEHQFGLSAETKEFLPQIKRNIQIIVLCAENDMNTLYQKSDNNISANYFKKLFSDYKHYGEKVTVDYVDVDTNPGYLSKYNIDNTRIVSTSIAIVRCADNGKYKVLDQKDILLTQSTGTDILGANASYYNVTEFAVTSAIQIVMRDNATTAYLLEGHGENQSTYLSSRLSNLGYNVETINLTTTEKFADNASIMLCFGPSYDFSAEEITKLQKFIENGGYYGRSFFFSTNAATPRLANIQSYLDTQWGLKIKENVLVDLAYQTSGVMAINYTDEELARPLMARGISSFFSIADAKELELDTTRFSDIGVFYKTLETSYSRPIKENDTTQKATDKTGEFPVVAYNKVTGLSNQNGVATPGYVCVASGSSIFADESVGTVNMGNGDYLDRILYKLSNLDTNNEIYVPSKTIGSAPLAVISDVITSLLFTVYIILIPLAVIIAGVVVSLRRRHL